MAFVTVSQLDGSVAERERHGMRPIDGAQFSHRPLRVLVDGSFRDVENFADFPGRFAVRCLAENFALARR